MRNSIEQLLDSDRLKAQSFEDPEDFLAYARSRAVPLAVLNVWMPKMSGLEVQAQLQVESPNTKVIVVAGQEIAAIRTAALEGGAFAFLLKPFDDEEFLASVRQAIHSAREVIRRPQAGIGPRSHIQIKAVGCLFAIGHANQLQSMTGDQP